MKREWKIKVLAWITALTMMVSGIQLPANLAYAADQGEGVYVETETPSDAQSEVTTPAETPAEPEETQAEESIMPAEDPSGSEEAQIVESTPAEEVTAPETDAEEPAAVIPDESPAAEEPAETAGEEIRAADENAGIDETGTVEETVAGPELNNSMKTFLGSANAVFVKVVASEGTFPKGTEMKVTAVGEDTVRDAVEEAMGSEIGNIKAVDITFWYEGEEVQPLKEVKVQLTTQAFQSEQNVNVVHIEDVEKKDVEVMELTKATDTTAVFATDGFSVYVVVETVVPRLTVNFKNGTTDIATMYVKEADTAEEVADIIYDPGAGTISAGQVFKGWTTEQNYTANTTFMTISDVRADAMARAAALSGADGSVTYYTAIFKQYTVTYVDSAGITVGTEAAEIPARETNATYTVNMGYSTDDKHNFEGGVVKEGSENIVGHPTEDAEEETITPAPKSTDGVNTGDANAAGTWTALILSAMAAAFLLLLGRKRFGEEE